jgi:hypothetical protein
VSVDPLSCAVVSYPVDNLRRRLKVVRPGSAAHPNLLKRSYRRGRRMYLCVRSVVIKMYIFC